MIELYHSGTSVCAAKVRLALAEKGIGWSGHYLDILKGDQFAPAYLRLNPKAVVPTLVHDGTVVRESTVINEYLDEAFPASPLRPATPAGRAAMRLWTKLVDEDVHPACILVTFVASHRFSVIDGGPENVARFIEKAPDATQRARRRAWIEGGLDAPDVAAAAAAYDKVLGQMDAALAGARWLAGDALTLADIALVPYVNRFAMLGLSARWEGRRPHLARWFDAVRARDSFEPGIYTHMPAKARTEMETNAARSAAQLLAMLDG